MQKVVIEAEGTFIVATRIDGTLVFISAGGRSKPTRSLKAARVYSSEKRAMQGARAFGVRNGIKTERFHLYPTKISYYPAIRVDAGRS